MTQIKRGSPTDDPDLATLTIPECAAMLKVSSSHLYRVAKRGELPGAFMVGNSIRVHRGRLLKWLETGATDPASPPMLRRLA